MIQQRVGDPTGRNPGGVWVSPMRDIAHCGPLLFRQAIALAESRVGKIDGPEKEKVMGALGTVAVALAKYVKLAATSAEAEDHKDAMTKSGLVAATSYVAPDTGEYVTLATALMSRAMLDVMLQVYFQSIREALHPGETPLGVKELMALVDERHA